jgi:guanidinoacetate N-methyltransferase
MALSIDGHAVMERWETPYMAALAAIAAAPGGPVLEIGYGLGISCEQIGNHEPERHVVIECHPEVAARMLSEQRQAVSAGRLELAVGTWQRHTHRWMNGTFSGILFDPYPLTDHEMRGPHYDFFAEARRLLRPGGVLTYYSDEPSELAGRHWDALIAAGFLPLDIGWETVQVDVPPDCEYWSSPTIVAPIVYRR